jgi:hypothetical protein
MGMVHELLEASGKQGALEAGIDRSVVEAAAQYQLSTSATKTMASGSPTVAGHSAPSPISG